MIPNLRSFSLFLAMLFSLVIHAQVSPQQSSKVDQVFSHWAQPDRPGGALAVIRNGSIIYHKGYGMADLEHDIPIDSKSVFYIGSVSKQFVAMCMLLLEEQGKIDLDADIRTYLPDFPDYGHPITIRNLIHHTSGIRDNLTLWELKGRSHLDEIPESEIYDLIIRQEKLNFEPGTAYRYSNSCYFMMSMIVKRVTGQTLREYADTHIFKKLGMSNTFFGDDNRRIIRNRAFGYHENDAGEIENMIMRFDLVGSGGLYSSVEDLFHWDQNFYHNKLGHRGQALIDDMLTNGRYKDGTEVDYAFALDNGRFRGLKTISHSGSLGGYRAFYIQFPEQQFSVILLGNVTNFDPVDKAYDVAEIFLAEQLLPEQPAAPTAGKGQENRKVEEIVIDDLSPYTGRYYAPELDFHYDLKQEGKQLELHIGEASAYQLAPSTALEFRMSHGWSVEFQRDRNKKITGFLLNAGRVSGLRFEKVE